MTGAEESFSFDSLLANAGIVIVQLIFPTTFVLPSFNFIIGNHIPGYSVRGVILTQLNGTLWFLSLLALYWLVRQASEVRTRRLPRHRFGLFRH